MIETRDKQAIRNQARADQVLEAFKGGLMPATIKRYIRDLDALGLFMCAPSRAQLVVMLLDMPPGQLNEVAALWRDQMVKGSMAPSTVNRRLAMLSSFVDTARVLGHVTEALQVKRIPSKSYRDTRGPENVRELLDAAAAQPGYKGARDYALIRLLYDMALRVTEALTLDLEHYGHESRVHVLRKGRREREPRTVPGPTREALEAWLALRGLQAGPIFVSLTRAGTIRRPFRRLAYGNAYRAVRKIGKLAGSRVKPHGLRHASITRALDLSGGDVRAVKEHSGHARVETVLVYDDQRTDLAGFIASQVAASTTEEGAEKMAADLLEISVKAALKHLDPDVVRHLVEGCLQERSEP